MYIPLASPYVYICYSKHLFTLFVQFAGLRGRGICSPPTNPHYGVPTALTLYGYLRPILTVKCNLLGQALVFVPCLILQSGKLALTRGIHSLDRCILCKVPCNIGICSMQAARLQIAIYGSLQHRYLFHACIHTCLILMASYGIGICSVHAVISGE